jgi:glycosyltransferase involved in cell wall biosynthesis
MTQSSRRALVVMRGDHDSGAAVKPPVSRPAVPYDGRSARGFGRMKDLSVVIPVYGCDSCLTDLCDRLQRAIEPLTDDYELIFVDDRSPDGSWTVLQGLAQERPALRLVRLSRNFGQHAAITAGLFESSGRRVVVMDCDLQDRPEDIPRLWAEAEKGYEVVLSRRRRRSQSLLRRLTGHLYYRLRNVLVRTDMYTNYTNLSMISRKVVEAFLTLRDKDRQYLLIVDWLGFEQTTVEVDPADRRAGNSSYNWRRLVKVAVDGMFFQTTVLLRWIVYVGFSLALLGALLASYTLIVYAFGRPLPAWTGLPVLTLLLAGFIIISTGVAALYIGKIFDQVKGRPLYVVDTKVVGGEERAFARDLPGETRDREAAVASSEPEPDTPLHS